MYFILRKRLLYKLIPNRPTLVFDLSFKLHLYDYKFDAYKYLSKHSKVIHIDSPLARPRRYRILIHNVPVTLIETNNFNNDQHNLHFSMHVQCTYRDALKQIQWFYNLRNSIIKSNLLAMPSNSKVYIKYHCASMSEDGTVNKEVKRVGIQNSSKMLEVFKKSIWLNCVAVNH